MVSRSDKLFQKRKPKKVKDLTRRKATRSERARVLILCEGEKTEPLYLKSLVDSLGLTTADVEVCGECDSAPTSVVEFGKEKLTSDSDFEFIYFVFDRDSHGDYDKALNAIKGLQSQTRFKGKTVAAITSIPCFEIWFLLHFEEHKRPYNAGRSKSPCGNLISTLKKETEFNNYEKSNSSYFELLHGRLPQAKINAHRTLTQGLESGESKHHVNPSTLMHILVDRLEKIAKESAT